jgi:hypothetical protein
VKALIAVAIALPALLMAAPAGAAAATEAAPSVTVSDGVDEAAPGSDADYVVAVENSGNGTLTGAVNLRVPEFVDVAAPDAAVDGGVATWALDLAPGESAEFHAQATFARSAGDAYQVVVLAEVADAAGTVVVRAADANRIPGAAAPESVPGLTGEPASGPSWVLRATVGGLIVLAGVAALVWWLLSRRRRSDARAALSASANRLSS